MLDERLALAADQRQQLHPDEHPLVSRLVVLRVALNHRYGADFAADFNHELADIEARLQAWLLAADPRQWDRDE